MSSPVRILTIIVALAGAALLGGCAAESPRLPKPAYSAAHPAPDDKLIVPGERIGKVYLGMTVSELYRAEGDPIKTDQVMGTQYYFSDGLHASVESGVVTGLTTDSPAHKTREGLGVGSSQLALEAAYGATQTSEITANDFYLVYKGVAFEIVHGRVATVVVGSR